MKGFEILNNLYNAVLEDANKEHDMDFVGGYAYRDREMYYAKTDKTRTITMMAKTGINNNRHDFNAEWFLKPREEPLKDGEIEFTHFGNEKKICCFKRKEFLDAVKEYHKDDNQIGKQYYMIFNLDRSKNNIEYFKRNLERPDVIMRFSRNYGNDGIIVESENLSRHGFSKMSKSIKLMNQLQETISSRKIDEEITNYVNRIA